MHITYVIMSSPDRRCICASIWDYKNTNLPSLIPCIRQFRFWRYILHFEFGHATPLSIWCFQLYFRGATEQCFHVLNICGVANWLVGSPGLCIIFFTSGSKEWIGWTHCMAYVIIDRSSSLSPHHGKITTRRFLPWRQLRSVSMSTLCFHNWNVLARRT